MKENQLGEKLSQWLEQAGWDVYPEAQIRTRGPRADIIAYKCPLLWAVEIKQTVSLQLLEQAYRWIELGAIQVSIAVPTISRRKAGKHQWHSAVVDKVLRDNGIGLIFIDDVISQPIKPSIHRYNYNKSKRILNNLDQRMQQYTPGNTAQDGYSAASHRVLEDAISIIKNQPGISLRTLYKQIKSPHYRTSKIKKYLLNVLTNSAKVKITQQGFDYAFELCEKGIS